METRVSHLPTHDILVLITVSACMVLITIWAFADGIRLARLVARGEA